MTPILLYNVFLIPQPPVTVSFSSFKRLDVIQSIQRIFHIQRNFFLPLAFDYCTLVRVIQVNKVFISLLTMETQGLPTPPAHVSKTTRYKLNISYDLFDFVFYNDYFANKKPWYCSGQGNKLVITMQVYRCIKTKPNTLFPYSPFFLTKENLVQPWSGEHTNLHKSISTLKINSGCLDCPLPNPKHC